MHRPDLSSVPLDPYWTSIEGLGTHAAFERLADAVAFRPEVPPDVAGRFDLVRAAVRHAAVEAVLADAAFSRALLTLELALACRHDDLGAPLPKNKRRLADLVDWGGTVPLFENGPEAVHAARRLRNELVAHPRGDARFFYHALQFVREVPLLVNELYDDSALRRERLDAWTGLRTALDAVTRDGAVLDASALGLARHLVYAAACPVVDNRGGPLRIDVLAWPLFEPLDPEAPTATPPPIRFRAASWTMTDDGVAFGLAGSDERVTVAPIRKEANATRFAAWRDAVALGHADLPALRALAAHHAGAVRHAHRHGVPSPTGGAVVERVASAPLSAP